MIGVVVAVGEEVVGTVAAVAAAGTVVPTPTRSTVMTATTGAVVVAVGEEVAGTVAAAAVAGTVVPTPTRATAVTAALTTVDTDTLLSARVPRPRRTVHTKRG